MLAVILELNAQNSVTIHGYHTATDFFRLQLPRDLVIRHPQAAGVSFEDRQDLLGHKSGRITTHYSAAELHNLVEAANRVSDENSRKSPALMILNRKTG